MVSKTGPSCTRGWLLLVALPFLLILAWWLRDSLAFVQSTHNGAGLFWSDSEVTLNLRLGCPSNGSLTEWGPCWDDAAEDAARKWNATGANFTFRIQSPSQPVDPCGGQDGLTTVVWADTMCGEAFGDATLAVTQNWFRSTGELIDSDVLFNTKHSWNTYSGSHRSYAIDFHRVAIHEFGHVLGLDHPDEHGQSVNAIMNSKASNIDRLQTDDIAGIKAIYMDSGDGGSGGGVALDFSITDECNDGRDIEYRFFEDVSDVSRQSKAWPSQYTVYVTSGYGQTHTNRLDCTPGYKVCYGARPKGDRSVHWGVGIDADQSCDNCCTTCPTSGTGEISKALICSDDGGGDDHGDTRGEATRVHLPSDTQGRLERRGDEDWFQFTAPQAGTLTVETTGSTDTSGTLYTAGGGWLDSDYDSGRGDNFRISREVSAGTYYVRVNGFLTTGSYTLHARFTAGLDDDHGDSRQEATNIRLPSDTQGTLERTSDEDYFRLSVPRSGTLTVETIGSTDTSGILYTADGFFLDFDFDSGSGDNFRIVHEVSAGAYYVEVSGFLTTGPYILRVRFTASGGGGSGNRGVLENPQPGAFKSGIGVISGWKCEAAGPLTVRFNGGNPIPLAYGNERSDTQSVCGDTNNGFVSIWNWSNLGDGTHTAVVYDSGVEFGRATFRVTTFGQEFLRGARKTITVQDFPHSGTTTVLEWEESSQNFVVREVR